MSGHVRYLEAKRGVDDRAIDRDVLSAFSDALPAEPTILEVGSGTATMPERLFEWGILDAGTWIAVDSHADALDAGRNRLDAREGSVSKNDSLYLGDLTVEFVQADAFEYVSGFESRVDAVVGSAFFDIVDAERAIAAFDTVTDLIYAPITYDGTTAFEPNDPEDEAVLGQYERHMRDYRDGGPDGARRLTSAFSNVIADAPSSWLIEPPYEICERTVTTHVIDTIEEAVAETGYHASEWAKRRRAQLSEGRLSYTATNRDVLGQP